MRRGFHAADEIAIRETRRELVAARNLICCPHHSALSVEHQRIAALQQSLAQSQAEVVRLKAELEDEALAFEYANEVIGKLEADLASLRERMASSVTEERRDGF